MAEWQVHVVMPIHWKGEDVPAGALVTGSSPEDDAAAAYWGCFGAWGLKAGRGGDVETPPPPGGEGENGEHGTAPMSTGQQSHVVGRRRATR
jgi:hypothetical protein